MNSGARRLALLQRLATLCVILVLTITCISAFIRLSNAGLGCADWPQCYGGNLRQAQHESANKVAESDAIVEARMVHRVVAVAALLVIMVMAIDCFTGKPLLWREGWMTLGLLALALFLAVLGRWSSGARAPAVVIGNLLGGFAMLALSWRLRRQVGSQMSRQTSEAADLTTSSDTTAPSGHTRMRGLAWLGTAVLLSQIVLGGLVSAGYAGLSCTDIPDCGGNVSRQTSLANLDSWREPVFASTATPPTNPAGAPAHMAHRYGAILVLLALLPLGLAALRSGQRRTAWVLLSLLVVQIDLGLLMVALSLPLAGALAHNLISALLLAMVFCLV